MDEISILMKPLFDKSRQEGKWFFTAYHGIWFSPDELEREQNINRKFRWGPDNWRLRDPEEFVIEARRKLEAAQLEYEKVLLKVAGMKVRGA